MVGHLQLNKAAAVARLGAVVHSVDRLPLARTLARAGAEPGRPVEVFLQVDLGGPEGELAARGGGDPAGGAALAGPAERVRADHPGARDLSAGMTADLEEAVAAGSTLLRVGTALFGTRPLPSPGDESHQSHGSQQPG